MPPHSGFDCSSEDWIEVREYDRKGIAWDLQGMRALGLDTTSTTGYY
jgi:hypothetical protein